MKKPHVLNRSMFKTGGTSAYGKGITSNLVSDEQRQRFNYGGRVGFQPWNRNRLVAPFYNTKPYNPKPWEYKYNPTPTSVERFPGETEAYEDMTKEDFDLLPGVGGEIGNEIIQDWYERQKPLSKEYKTYVTEKDEVPIDPDTGREREVVPPGEIGDTVTGQGYMDPVVEEEREGPFGGEPGTPIPGERDPSAASTITKADTDLLDTPDKWAFLDEQQKAKQKLARGHGLAEAAAAAAKWSTAGTAKERSAAISEGLSKVGAIGAKYKGEATDLKTKAKILGTIEEIKGEQKQKLWQDRLKGYYQPTLDIAEQGLALKKAAAELAAEGKDGLSIYDDILLTNSTSLRDPFTKRDILRSLTGKNLQVEGEKNKKTLNSKENKGLIFIDIQGNVVRNKGDGTTEDVDETRDEFFTWRN